MPPTFLIFLGLIVYIGASAVTLVVFVPMLFIDSKKLTAKKVLATVLISFPCLIVMGLFCTVIFAIPALIFFGLAHNDYIPRTPGIIVGVIGVFTFVVSVATSSLYLWYLISKIIYQRLDKKPIAEFLNTNKVFKFLRPYFIRLQLYSHEHFAVSRKKVMGIILGGICATVIVLVLFFTGIHLINDKKEVTKEEVYGEYVIDRKKFPGKQADWQYDHYRFEVTKQDSFLFHVTDKERIIKTYRGTAHFLPAYKIARLVLNTDTPRNHIIENMPTLYRSTFSFYYVFHSPKYNNVFFKRGRYEN